MAALSTRVDAAVTVDRWVDLAARMLVLGWLPGTAATQNIGHCLEIQNAVIDGGFVDLSSIELMADAPSLRAFHESVLITFSDLARTVRQFAAGPQNDAEAEYRNPTLPMLFTLTRVWDAVAARVRAYAQTVPADERLLAFFESGKLFDELQSGLGALFAAPGARSRHAAAPAPG
jgi:hypothetical protein